MAYSRSDSNAQARRTLKFGMGFVALLIVMAFIFFFVASHMERGQYHKGNLEDQPTVVPSQPPAPSGP